MDTIKFANGETHSCSYIATIPEAGTHMAIIAVNDMTFAEAAALFSDPNKTAEIEWGLYKLVGYTNLTMLGVEDYGIQAVLKGGHNEQRS